MVSAANAASRAEEKHALESDDEQDDELVSCAALCMSKNTGYSHLLLARRRGGKTPTSLSLTQAIHCVT